MNPRLGIVIALILSGSGLLLPYFRPDLLNPNSPLRDFFAALLFFALGSLLGLGLAQWSSTSRSLGRAKAEENERSLHDPITQAYTRRHMDKVLDQFWALGQSSGTPFSLLLLDIDNFRNINARFGHDVGDRVLQSIVQNIQGNTRKTDMVFRAGADRFLLLLPVTRDEFALTLANRLREEFAKLTFRGLARETFKADFSVGVIEFRKDLTGIEEMLRRVEGALMRAKKENSRISLAS